MSRKSAQRHASDTAPPKTASAWRAILREPLALGMAPLILLRPWLDGVTYSTDNFYFVWAVTLLFALWAARVFLRNEPIRFGTPALLLGGFWVVAALTAFNTVQYAATYRTLILWAGHFLLFIIASNGLRNRTAINIILAAFLVTSLAQSVWSLIHLNYVLPYLRESVKADPRLLGTYYGSGELNAELMHRLLVNRAFGSFLSPNSLAAFLMLSLPYALGSGVHSILTLLRAERRTPAGSFPKAALFGLCTWAATAGAAFYLMAFVGSLEYASKEGWRLVGPVLWGPDGQHQFAGFWITASWCGLVVALPVLLGVLAAYGWRRGADRLALFVQVVFLPPLSLVQALALWLTYSRGGILALALALIISVVLFSFPVWQRRLMHKRGIPAVAAVWLIAILGCCTLTTALAQTPETPTDAITREGLDLTVRDLANPASFNLRLGYWHSAFDMAKDNVLTGVGLGNFGTVYPQYRLLTAGPVKAAHNDYLQAACETGILGCLLFCGFWGYFACWGARRIMREQAATARFKLAVLYCGLLAFLLHSVIDFDFFNPSLAFFAVLLAGVFYAMADLDQPVLPAARVPWRMLVALLMVGAAILTGMTLRVFVADYLLSGRNLVNVGSRAAINELFETARFFLQTAPAAKSPKEGGLLPTVAILPAAKLIYNRADLESFGSIHTPDPNAERGHRRLQPSEGISEDGFLIVTNPQAARSKATEYCETWLGMLQDADSAFPHSPDMAMYFVRFYDLLCGAAQTPEKLRHYADAQVRWAEAGVARSPREAATQELLGRALLLRGKMETTNARWDYLDKSIDAYRTATKCYPTSASLWRNFGNFLVEYGKTLERKGELARSKAHGDEGQAALQRADELDAAHQKAGVP